FMEWFPTIQDLAEAPDDKLLKAWEGLGYYSRARNLKVAAQQIVSEFGGKMPDTIEDIRSLKGIGPYKAGAIGSIAFNLPEPAIDGNV
ncbi:A/G-specific adenine glycosylase, partial [Enterococcus faecium]